MGATIKLLLRVREAKWSLPFQIRETSVCLTFTFGVARSK